MPVNADVPSLEAILVEEHDPHVNALGIKGVGEIGITGTAGAIANAVWHATGVRVRQLSDHPRPADRSRSGLGKCDLPAGNRRCGELPLWVSLRRAVTLTALPVHLQQRKC